MIIGNRLGSSSQFHRRRFVNLGGFADGVPIGRIRHWCAQIVSPLHYEPDRWNDRQVAGEGRESCYPTLRATTAQRMGHSAWAVRLANVDIAKEGDFRVRIFPGL